MIKNINKIILGALVFCFCFLFFESSLALYNEYGYKTGCGYNSTGASGGPTDYDQCIHLPEVAGNGSRCENAAAAAGISCSSWGNSPVNVGRYDSKGHTICKFFCSGDSDRNFAIGGSHSTACTWTCGGWGACQSNSTQTRTCTSSPSGCVGSNPYPTTQSCTYTPVVNGACGTANGRTFGYSETSYGSYTQCSSGSPSTTAFPTSGSSVSWTCSGTNGGSSSGTCSASRTATPVNGACGTANGRTFSSGETSYGSYTQCSSGSPSTTAFPASGSSVSWTCSGTNGGSSVNCSASRSAAIVNGACGTANGRNFAYTDTGYYPYTQCSSGSPDNTGFPKAGSSFWWNCKGSNGGANKGCYATREAAPLTPVNGACGTANGVTFASSTTSYGSYTQCSSGSSSNGNFPSAGSSVSWTCSGANGG
jgi:hypothetical protein